MIKILWGITGTGYVLQESIDLMKDLKEKYGNKLKVKLKHHVDITGNITVILNKLTNGGTNE